jgi:hypothetical protein
MKAVTMTTRNVFFGLVLAAALSFFGSTSLLALCGADMECEEEGYDLHCTCSGSGTCRSFNSYIECRCYGFETQRCDCGNGCYELEQ